MNELAVELNRSLEKSATGALLSDFGKRMYFPKGIIAQSAQAKKEAVLANATIGMTLKGGVPMVLDAVAGALPEMEPGQIVAYAPTAGIEAVREIWKTQMLAKNPSLAVKNMTLPVVVPGITAGLSFVADLFLGDGDVIIASDPCWDNYSLIFEERRQARMRGVKMFTKWDSLDVDVIVDAIREEAKTGFVRVIFNFPNNPSGYSPTRAEAHSLISAVSDIARSGARVLAICDDAYFGFFYEEETSKESLFGALAGLHENVLAVKIDGPTKEDYVWGLRLAFVSFGSKALPAGVADALQKKLMGAIRSSVSCANTPAQSIFLKSAGDPHSSMEKEAAFAILKRRYERVKACVRRDNRLLSPLPFNSGYFMSFRCNGLDAHALRLRLLEQYGIGVIALGAEYIRVAFSSLDEDIIPEVYEKIYMCAQDVAALAHSETPPTTSRLQHH